IADSGSELRAHFSPVMDQDGEVAAVNLVLSRIEDGAETASRRIQEDIPYQQIVEEAIDVVYLTDQQGNFTYVNPPAEMLTGYAPTELIGMHFTALIVEERQAEIKDFYKDHYETQVEETALEFPIRRKDGTSRWIEQTVRLVTEDGQVAGFQGIARDIHMRKVAELALESSEIQYRSLVEASPMAIAVNQEGQLVYINPAGLALFGAKTMEEISSRPILSFIHPDFHDSMVERIEKAAEGLAENPAMTGKMIRLDGEVVEVEVASQPIIFNAKPASQIVFKELSELKRASEELKSYADRLEVQNRIDQAILTAQSTREIAEIVAQQMRKLVPSQRVTVTLFDHQTKEVIVIASDLDTDGGTVGESRFPMHGGYPPILEGQDMLLIEDLETKLDPNQMEKQLLAKGIRTYLNIPLRARGELVGSLNLGANLPGHFTEEYIHIARELAGSLSVAFDQARLYEEVNQHASQLEKRVHELNESERYLALLNEITRASISVDNLETLLETLEVRLSELFEAESCNIILLGRDPREARPAALDVDSATPTKPLGSLRPRALSALEFGKAIYWGEGDTNGLKSHEDSPTRQITHLSLPLIASDRKLGAVLIAFREPRPLGDDDVAKGEQATGQIALAVAKASLLDSERRRRKEAETLRTVSNALASTLDLQQVLDIILDQLAVVMEYDSAAILLWEGEVVKAVAGRGFRDYSLAIGEEFPVENFLFDQIRQTLEPLWLSDPNEDPRFSGWGGTEDIASWMGLPLVVHGKLIGFMTLDSYARDTYGAPQASLVQPFANQAAQAIENASLFDWVQRQAVTDALTNIYNRRGFFELGQREVDRALRFNRELVAIMLDIDLFKQVNDRVGHAVGDQVLIEIADRCVQVLRRVDLIGRYGGEEFAILLPETEVESAEGIAERLREAVAGSDIITDRGPIPVTISLGVAGINPAVRDLASLLDAADTAMYAAKQAGRNCVKRYYWEKNL
ncbi:MAG: diguanylate cyclase, partial [Anaerolineales bacterium]|nr:diguanylate cyclase [Anaerolineales bacterium]